MIRPRIAGLAVLAFALFLAPPAHATIPVAANCSVENVLIGSWTGAGIPTALTPCGPNHPELFEVIVRDAGNNPIAGSTVKVLLAGSGLRFHTAQNPGVTNVCPGEEMDVKTDASGTARVSLRFAGSVDTPAVLILADGVALATVPARSPDYDGDGRVSLSDLTVFSADYLAPALPHPRSDFDNCPGTTLPDLAYFVNQFLASNNQPAAALCP